MRKLILNESQYKQITERENDFIAQETSNEVYLEISNILSEIFAGDSVKAIKDRISESPSCYYAESKTEGVVTWQQLNLYINTKEGFKLSAYHKPFILRLNMKHKNEDKGVYSSLKNIKQIGIFFISKAMLLAGPRDFFKNFTKHLRKRRYTFIHEFNHMLDDLRSDGKILRHHQQLPNDLQKYSIQNSELNVRFHQAFSPIYEELAFQYKEFRKIWDDPQERTKAIEDYENAYEVKLNEKNAYNTLGLFFVDVCTKDYLPTFLENLKRLIFVDEIPDNIKKKLSSRFYTLIEQLKTKWNLKCKK